MKWYTPVSMRLPKESIFLHASVTNSPLGTKLGTVCWKHWSPKYPAPAGHYPAPSLIVVKRDTMIKSGNQIRAPKETISELLQRLRSL